MSVSPSTVFIFHYYFVHHPTRERVALEFKIKNIQTGINLSWIEVAYEMIHPFESIDCISIQISLKLIPSGASSASYAKLKEKP